MNIEQTKDSIKITIKERENYTISDLKQKIINYLMKQKGYGSADVELIKVIMENQKD